MALSSASAGVSEAPDPSHVSAARGLSREEYCALHDCREENNSVDAERLLRRFCDFLAETVSRAQVAVSPGLSSSTSVSPGLSAQVDVSPCELEPVTSCARQVEAALRALLSQSPPRVLFWMDYGAALVCTSVSRRGTAALPAPQDLLHLWVLAPDGYRFDPQTVRPPGSRFSSEATCSSRLNAGVVAADAVEELLSDVQRRINEAQKVRGEDRSAAGGKQGHQKTPAFILAVVLDALEATKEPAHKPRGGFTDVGLHTGGERRDVRWPLARAVLEFLFERASAEFELQMHFDLVLVQWQTWLAEGACAATPPLLRPDELARLVEAAALGAAPLADVGWLPADVLPRLEAARGRLDAAAAERDAAAAARWALSARDVEWSFSASDVARLFAPAPQVRLPLLGLPPAVEAPSASSALEASRARADRNLGLLPLLPGDAASASVASVLAWQRRVSELLPTQHQLRLALITIERWIFRRALVALAPRPTVARLDFRARRALVALAPRPTVARLDAREVGELEDIVCRYHAHVAKLYPVAAPAPVELAVPAELGGRLRVELRSRETLVLWGAACLVDDACRVLHPLLARAYGVALDGGDLRHLVLSDGLSRDALLVIAAYLQRQRKVGPPVFSLLPDDASIKFATSYGQEDAELQRLYVLEKDDAEKRMKAHWTRVREMKELVLRCRQALEKSEIAVQSARQRWIAPSGTQYEYQLLKMAESDRDQKQRDYKAALGAPPPVVQPLPAERGLALAVLFFLYTPPALRTLARLLNEAQQALLPRPLSEEHLGLLSSVVPYQDMCACEHFNSNGGGGSPSTYLPERRPGSPGSQGHLFLRAQAAPEVDTIGARLVEDLASPSDGVWHPDVHLTLHWRGGLVPQRTSWSPWRALPARQLVDYYTVKLPDSSSALQWMMRQAGAETACTRGNEPVARQPERPKWLSPPAWLAFGSLRARPYLQARKLAVALRERSLPLTNTAVQLLVRQSLYHVGELRGEPPAPAWHADLLRGDAVYAVVAELGELAGDMRERVSDSSALSLIADVACFLRESEHGRTHGDNDELRRLCVVTARRWASALDARVEASTDSKAIAQLLALQCMHRMRGLLFFSGGWPMGAGDARELAGLAVEVRSGLVHEADASDEPAFSALAARCRLVLASRVDEMRAAADADAAAGLLSAAAKLVLPHLPPDLVWARVPSSRGAGCDRYDTGCYEAVAEGVLYSVSLLTGAVLVDGSPPGSLPADVLAHRAYKRSFSVADGDRAVRDFPIVRDASGRLRTLRPVARCFYEFRLGAHGRLGVREICQVGDDGACDEDDALEMLDSEDPAWCPDLPPRLRELHSHWLHRASRTLVLRPRHFLRRDIAFIVLLGDEAALSPARCFRVPHHRQGESWKELLCGVREKTLREVLIVWDEDDAPRLVQVLSKFEEPRYIHAFMDDVSCSGFLLELPRYSREFVLERSSTVRSLDYVGYELALDQQQLRGTLAGFAGYLVLQPGPELQLEALPGRVKLLVADGEVKVERSDDGVVVVSVDGDSEPGAVRESHAFEVHARFGDLRAPSIAARLQLAALYAACSGALPEQFTGFSGAEMAMRLVRRCATDRPLLPKEAEHLRDVVAHSRHIPALVLLCADLAASSERLAFLYDDDDMAAAQGQQEEAARAAAADGGLNDAKTAYVHYVRLGSCNPRHLLTAPEEGRLLGGRIPRRSPFARPPPQRDSPGLVLLPDKFELWPPRGYVGEVEQQLHELVSRKPRAAPPPASPIALGREHPLSALGREMLDELQESWREHHEQVPIERIAPKWEADSTGLEALLRERLVDAGQRRKAMESWLMAAADALPEPGSSLAWAATGQRLLRAAGRAPRWTVPELVAVLALSDDDESALETANPFLAASEHAGAAVRDATRLWLQLACLEDRLGRVCRIAAAENPSDSPALVAELLSSRSWDPDKHPEWLIFEVDGGLQVRPVQALVARTMIDEPGTIVQLNMGEGKTRVILPLLILHFTQHARRRAKNRAYSSSIVRLHMLPELLAEGAGYLHEHLTAGLLNVPLFQMVFSRDVPLTAEGVARLCEHAERCREEGGALLVTPGSRCSLHLQGREAARSRSEAAAAKAVAAYEALPWRDVFDETDAALRTRFQLVYAVGARTPLPALSERAIAVSALLRAAQLSPLLSDERVAVRRAPRVPGAFLEELRLLPGPALNELLPHLLRALAAAVFDDPPYEFAWMKSECGGEKREAALRYVCDATLDASMLKKPHNANAMLAMRGLLAFGILSSCLTMRHRVTYGVGAVRGNNAKPRRIARPFAASDVPSERTEFTQPDMTLTLTTLAYYADGLQRDHVHEALEKLLRLGEAEQASYYETWWAASKPGVSPEHAASVDNVRKLDLSNAHQLDTLWHVFSRNTGLCDFFLACCVLPDETAQYPNRVKATASHLLNSTLGPAVGFSGTNDQHRLLPPTVNQRSLLPLSATNGAMLAKLVECAVYRQLPKSADDNKWQRVLRFAVENKAVALIDVGALLAGVSQLDAAKHVVHLLQRQNGLVNPAVTFFDNGCWWVMNAQQRRWPLASSPVAPRDAFALFDEARCRGSDLKLRRDGLAVLTLGPRLCKDSFMQAAGRMRQLGRGQRLVLVAEKDVHAEIFCAGAEYPQGEVARALRWVMRNTIAAGEVGLSEWAAGVMHYAETELIPDADPLLPEQMRLEELYGAAAVPASLGKAIPEALRQRLGDDWERSVQPQARERLRTVIERVKRFGTDVHAHFAALGEECEREVEREQEQEQEQEILRPREQPRPESEWTTILDDLCKAFVPAEKKQALSLFVRERLATQPALRAVAWASTADIIYGTHNLLHTLDRSGDLCAALPAFDAFVTVGATVLLISDSEANTLLESYWKADKVTARTKPTLQPTLQHLSFARRGSARLAIALDGSNPITHFALSPRTLATLAFAAGATTFCPEEINELPRILPNTEARGAAPIPATLRGLRHLFPRSDLEKAAKADFEKAHA